MVNIPGASNPVPGPYTDPQTLSSGVSIPGGDRTACLMGEALTREVIISSALGSGLDGWNPAFTSTTSGTVGRFFKTQIGHLISNRFTLFRNGVTLTGLEEEFDQNSGSFSSLYDYRYDIVNGHIELQVASLVDQGGSFWSAFSGNTGTGTIQSLTLVDENAPTETWTVRCVSVRRDGYGDPIDGYARFIAQGSGSGILLDGYGNVITWTSDGVVVSNGILSFGIVEGATAFQEGDKFTIKVKSGALTKGDSLVATYIPETYLNDPQFFTNIGDFTLKHGLPSLSNYLALGAQLSFAQSPPGIWACQTAPSIPRRISYELEASASGSAGEDDLTFPLPLGVVPDADSNIHFFVTDPTTETETQIIPNKVDFYNATYTTNPNTFIFGSSVYSYTVVLEDAATKTGDDGVVTSIGPHSATFSSVTDTFDSGDVGLVLKILTPNVNAGEYAIVSVTDGVATISDVSFVFTNSTGVEFEVIDNTQQTANVLFTDDLALAAGQSLRATVVDVKDASFYDAGWETAFEALEKIDTNIVVPLPSQTISTIFQNGKAHVESMSDINNKKERCLFIGAINGLTPDNLLGLEDAAVEDIGILEGIQGDSVDEILASNTEDLVDYSVSNAFGDSFRVVYFYPDSIIVQVGADRLTLDGFFIAAAAAGLASKLPIQIPMTRKTLSGFSILRTKLLAPSVKGKLSFAGVAIVEPIAGGGKILWGRTTTSTGTPELEEYSIIAIRDAVAQAARFGLDAFIGTAEESTLISSVMGRLVSILSGLKSRKWITNYKDIKVFSEPTDPRQINVEFAVRPAYPINWIYIKFTVGNI